MKKTKLSVKEEDFLQVTFIQYFIFLFNYVMGKLVMLIVILGVHSLRSVTGSSESADSKDVQGGVPPRADHPQYREEPDSNGTSTDKPPAPAPADAPADAAAGGKDAAKPDQLIAADILKYPWHAQVTWSRRKYRSQICSGAIVTEVFVLTAAHCVTKLSESVLHFIKEEEISVRAGTGKLNSGGHVKGVSKIFTHPQFASTRSTTMAFDMAAIKVLKPFPLGPTIKAIKLPTPDMTYILQDLKYKNVQCTITGFGGFSEDSPPSSSLLVAEVSLTTTEKCVELSKNIGFRVADESHICSFEEDGWSNKSCIGDGGSGLVCNSILWGILSFGLQCNATDAPTVYTRVDRARQFLKDSMNSGARNLFDMSTLWLVLASPFVRPGLVLLSPSG